MLSCLLRMNRTWSRPLLETMTFPIYSFSTGQPSGSTMTLDTSVFAVPFRIDFVHNVFHYYRMMNKITTHRTIRFKDCYGSKRKVRPQKGSGKARAGLKFAPRMKGGVKAHGPVPRNFSINLNKKLVLQALKVTLAAKLHDQSLIIVDNYPSDFKKTKEADKALKIFANHYTLVAPEEFKADFIMATRRLEYFTGITVDNIKVLDLVKAKKILFTVDAITKLQEKILASEKKLYMNRKLYRKINEEKRREKLNIIDPVVVKSKVLKDIIQKYDLDIQTA